MVCLIKYKTFFVQKLVTAKTYYLVTYNFDTESSYIGKKKLSTEVGPILSPPLHRRNYS